MKANLLFPMINPLFPALRSGPTAISEASRQKQIPSNKTQAGQNEVWQITVANPNPYAFPLGLTEWGDFSEMQLIRHSENVKEAKSIGNTLIFIRSTAAPGSSSTFKLEFKRR